MCKRTAMGSDVGKDGDKDGGKDSVAHYTHKTCSTFTIFSESL